MVRKYFYSVFSLNVHIPFSLILCWFIIIEIFLFSHFFCREGKQTLLFKNATLKHLLSKLYIVKSLFLFKQAGKRPNSDHTIHGLC